METTTITPTSTASQTSTQPCTHCGQQNPLFNAFCLKCGEPLKQQVPYVKQVAMPIASSEVQSNMNNRMKVMVVVIGVLACLSAIVGAGYLVYVKKQEKNARDFVALSSQHFQNIIAGINALSTETNISGQENNALELITKKYEEEEVKLEKLQQDISQAQQILQQPGRNSRVAVLEQMLIQFYTEAYEKNKTYLHHVDYNIKSGKEMSKFATEMEKLRNNTKSITSEDELKYVFTSLRDNIDKANNSIKDLVPPQGLEESHNKSVEIFTEISTNLSGVIIALEERDQQKFVQNLTALDEAFSNTQRLQEIQELDQYYYEELHKKYINLREKADKIKTEYVLAQAVLKAEIKEISIEGW